MTQIKKNQQLSSISCRPLVLVFALASGLRLLGDVHPLPGPNQTNVKIDIPKELKANVKVAHLNVRSLKSREHFSLVKDTIILNSFDIFTII